MCVPSGITLGSTATTPQPTGIPVAVLPGQRVRGRRDGQRPAAGRASMAIGSPSGAVAGDAPRRQLLSSACSAAATCDSIAAICCAFSSSRVPRARRRTPGALRARAGERARRRGLRARRGCEPRRARARASRGAVDRAPCASLSCVEHVLVDRGDVLEAVELDERLVERLRAEDDLERARRPVVVEQPERDASCCCETRAPPVASARSRPSVACSRRSASRPAALRAARARLRRELRVERVQAQHGERALDASVAFSACNCADGSRDRTISAPPTAGRARTQEAAAADAEQPPPRRVCLPKHGRNPSSEPKNREKQHSRAGSTSSVSRAGRVRLNAVRTRLLTCPTRDAPAPPVRLSRQRPEDSH